MRPVSLFEAQLNAISLGGIVAGGGVGTEVEGFVEWWLCFKVTQYLRNLYPRGGGEARFYGFLAFKDRLHREILNGPDPLPTTAHMRGWVQDSVQNLARRGRGGIRSTQNEEKVRHMWLCSPHLTVA